MVHFEEELRAKFCLMKAHTLAEGWVTQSAVYFSCHTLSALLKTSTFPHQTNKLHFPSPTSAGSKHLLMKQEENSFTVRRCTRTYPKSKFWGCSKSAVASAPPCSSSCSCPTFTAWLLNLTSAPERLNHCSPSPTTLWLRHFINSFTPWFSLIYYIIKFGGYEAKEWWILLARSSKKINHLFIQFPILQILSTLQHISQKS